MPRGVEPAPSGAGYAGPREEVTGQGCPVLQPLGCLGPQPGPPHSGQSQNGTATTAAGAPPHTPAVRPAPPPGSTDLDLGLGQGGGTAERVTERAGHSASATAAGPRPNPCLIPPGAPGNATQHKRRGWRGTRRKGSPLEAPRPRSGVQRPTPHDVHQRTRGCLGGSRPPHPAPTPAQGGGRVALPSRSKGGNTLPSPRAPHRATPPKSPTPTVWARRRRDIHRGDARTLAGR